MANLKTNSITTYSGTNIDVTGSLNITGDLTQNGAPIGGGDAFPYTGDAEIIGSLNIANSTLSPNKAWSAGGNLITGRRQLAGAGTQNAGLAFGGRQASPPFPPPGFTSTVKCTEEYDGTSWSAGGDMITERYWLAGTGTQTAGLAIGGLSPYTSAGACTEEYDGSSWSAGGALITERRELGGAGTQNAGLVIGGSTPTSGLSCTEEYDGSSWSVGGALITARKGLGSTGTQNAALAVSGVSGGFSNTYYACTEEYNGTSWATGGIYGASAVGLGAAGTQNAGLAFGGYNQGANKTSTYEYDGTTWSAGGNLITARACHAAAGAQDAALSTGGTPGYLSSTEEYEAPTVINNVLTISNNGTTTGNFEGTTNFNSLKLTGSAEFSFMSVVGEEGWSTGPAINSPRTGMASFGTDSTSGAIAGGNIAPASVACTEEYDGTSWSVGGDLNDARQWSAATGTQTTGLMLTGRSVSTGQYVARSETYDGTSWSCISAPLTVANQAATGEQNSALSIGGFNPSYVGVSSRTEEYNGSSWTVGGSLTSGRYSLSAAGTQNAGLAFGGAASLSCTEEYDGTSWSAGGALITGRGSLGGGGIQSAGLAFGGSSPISPGANGCTEEYDGISWSSKSAMLTGLNAESNGTGTSTSAFSVYACCTPNTQIYNNLRVPLKSFDYSSTTGETTVSCLIETSAERYKSNIQPLGSQLSNIMNLQPVEFDWKTNKKHDIGFVADSVESVYPNLVSKNDKGEIEGMNYSKLVSALVKSMQEQQTQIQNLTTKLNNYLDK